MLQLFAPFFPYCSAIEACEAPNDQMTAPVWSWLLFQDRDFQIVNERENKNELPMVAFLMHYALIALH